MIDISSALASRGEEAAAVVGFREEALAVLTAQARGKSGAIPSAMLAEQVLGAAADADFAVLHDAMDALLRRVTLAHRDGLKIVRRPARRARFGVYRTGSEGAAPKRPWTTLLRSVQPLSASCDCPDFIRGSLGVCKHIVAVLEDVLGRESSAALAPHVTLRWDPIRPLTGEGDWLSRVTFHQGPPRRGPKRIADAAARRWFDAGGQLVSPLDTDPARRLELVTDLLRFARLPSEDELRAEPALLPLLERELERLSLQTKDGLAGRELDRALVGLRHPLYPYQKEGVARFLQTGRLLLADDMGLGKTAQAIASCHALFQTGKVQRGLVLVPAALKPQWEREWREFTDIPLTVVDGGAEVRRDLYRRAKKGFLLANYEQVLRDLTELQRFDPEVVVLDEAQRIKNWATRTSASVKQLRPARRLVLTGTPMENRLSELASLIDWVDDLALEPKWRLGSVHSTRQDGSKEVVGAKNLDTLRARLSGCMLRRRRKDVLGQLPERTDTRIPVQLTPEQIAHHDELNQPIASLVRRARVRPLSQPEFLKLMSLMTTQRVICNGLGQLDFEEVWPVLQRAPKPTEALLKSLCAPKLLELRELVAQIAIGQERKIVVFSQWRRMLKLAAWAVSDLLGEAGLRAAFFTGEEGQKRRTQNLVDFHDDPATRILFASDAGGVGLNLQKAASCLINLELPWNPAVLEQRIGRVHRMGQKRPVEVYHLVSAQGIEARIAGVVGDKRALFEGLFDGGSDEVSFERSGSFLSRMDQVLAPAVVPSEPANEATEDVAPMGAGDGDPEVSDAEVLGEQPGSALAQPPPAVAASAAPAAPHLPGSAASVAELFASIELRPSANGKVVFEAPPEAAAALAAMFQGMAKLLGSAGG